MLPTVDFFLDNTGIFNVELTGVSPNTEKDYRFL